MAQVLASIAGALLTLIGLAALGAGGYLLALRLVGRERARADTLELAVAWLLCATALGVGIALALGACGQLRLRPALTLAVAAAVALLPWRSLDRGWPELAGPARLLGRRLAARLRQHWALSLLAFHAIGSEALRGLVRPPLSWDSLMYHLLLTATWLQRHDLAPVFGAYPTSYYGYSPANGSVWLWWWMAPSHGELYANLAFLPQWALLGLATGAVARRLGARDSWPLAALLVAMTPTVVRFAATQYVDVFTAACLLAGCCFGLRWLRQPRWGAAVLAAMGLGLAAGAKVLGLAYAGALAAALLPLAQGAWRRRAAQAVAALAVAVAMGGFFYLRNAARGVSPLALECEGIPPHLPAGRGLPHLPRPKSVAAEPRQMLAEGQLLRALLGTVDSGASVFHDLGLGPQAFLVLLGLPALGALPRQRWREAAVAGSQLLAEAAIWVTVPYAADAHVFANVRYLLPAVGLALAGGVAAAESRRADPRWLGGIALAVGAQDLLQLHTELSDGVRLAVAVADVAAVAFAFSPRLRAAWHAPGVAGERAEPGAAGGPPDLAGEGAPGAGGPDTFGARDAAREPLGAGRPRRAAPPTLRPGAAAALALAAAAILCTPWLARFRVADRTRAFSHEYTAHGINVAYYASGWDWLDRHAGAGTVAVVNAPDTFFIYPAMGPYLARRALYVNVNASNLREAAAYPLCQPRVRPDPAAWIANLRQAGVRWLDLTRTPPFPFPMESGWARAHPELFVPRFADPNNQIYELLPPGAAPEIVPGLPGAGAAPEVVPGLPGAADRGGPDAAVQTPATAPASVRRPPGAGRPAA
jgi:hypothetical protein